MKTKLKEIKTLSLLITLYKQNKVSELDTLQ